MTVIRSTQEVALVVYTSASDIRVTQQYVGALYTPDSAAIRLTQQYVQALVTPDTAAVRVTQQYIQVLYTEKTTTDITAGIEAYATVSAELSKILPPGKEPLDADINGTASVTAVLKDLSLKASIEGSGEVSANISGKRQLTASIEGTGEVTGDILSFVRLVSAVTSSGTVDANLRKNIEYLAADIDGTGEVTANINAPWKAGNTLLLTQEVNVNLVKELEVSSTLNLQDELILTFGQRSLDANSELNLTDSATVIRALQTRSVSNSLTLTQSLTEYREAVSYLILSQSVTSTIDFIEGLASNTLTLSDSVSLAGSVFDRDVANSLVLTDSVSNPQVAIRSAFNTLSLRQNVFPVVLKTTTYVLFQAPFEFIETSIVVPNPLLDDNENLISNLVTHRSMDNTLRTYVQTNENRRVRYTFTLSRLKALELEAFFDSYNGADIKMTNWKGEVWKVKLITNPIDYVQTRRAHPNGDRTDVNLEFEGLKLYG